MAGPNYMMRLRHAFTKQQTHSAAQKEKELAKELVMFHGEHSGQSKAHKKMVEDACDHYGLKPRIVDISSEKGLEEAVKHKIPSAPSVAVIENGKPIDHYTGGKSREEVHHFIGKNFGSVPKAKPKAGATTKHAGERPVAEAFNQVGIDWGKRLRNLRVRQGKCASDDSASKEEIKWSLQKHEDRETPAQEKQESAKEQSVEEKAGIHEKNAFWNGFSKEARALSSKARKNLSSSDFVFPGERRYPIHDKAHARNALARAGGKPEEAKVRAAVKRRYPGIE